MFENRAAPAENLSLRIEVVGDPSAGINLDAIGTQLRLTLRDGTEIWRAVTGGEGYLGMSERSSHFGLGASQPRSLEILWPDGRLETLMDLPSIATDAGSARLRITYRDGAASEVAVVPETADGP